MNYFLQSVWIGFAMASVIGPISILCIKQTINYGVKVGFVSTLGATTADIFYAASAAYGLTMISDFLIANQFFLRFFGGSFLLLLGVKTIFSKMPKATEIKAKEHNLWANYFAVTFLTISNPLTIILYLSVFASAGFMQDKNLSPLLITLGITLGSILAYIVLLSVVVFLKKKVSENSLKIFHFISGVMISGFAIYAIWGAFL